MFKQNIVLYLRNIHKHKTTFLINLVGLSSGLACVLLVYLWVSDELAMDKFHEHDEQLYQVRRNVVNGDGTLATFTSNSSLMLPALQQEVPEVEMAVAVYEFGNDAQLETAEKKLSSLGICASEDFFNLFSYPLIKGNAKTILSDVNSVVISMELAQNLFGELSQAVGQTMVIKKNGLGIKDVFTITGIFEIPKNSSENFDFVLPFKTFLKFRNPSYINWYSNSSSMYALLAPNTNISTFNQKMGDFVTKRAKFAYPEPVFFSRYSDNYLRGNYENGKQTGGRITYVILFSIVAVFVLSIACINFMNLSTARATRRLKEVGVKKAIGAKRKSLVVQFLFESVLLSFFSLACAVLLVMLLLPWFNTVASKELAFAIEGKMLFTLFFVALLTGLVAGSYPALYLTKFSAVNVLKGKINNSLGELLARKGLVIFQFSISILLIVAVGVIYMQLDYLQSKNLGYDKDNIIIFEITDGLNDKIDVFLEQAKQLSGVTNATYMQGGMTNFSNSSRGHSWPGQTEESKNITFRHAHVGPEFIETMGIELKEGRTYINEKPNNESKIILNETAVDVMGLENPIGTVINMRGPNREVIGVVKDFNIQSLYNEISPMALLCRTEWISNLVVKIKAGEEKNTIASLEKLYNEFNPGLAFDFSFLDHQYQKLYQSEQRVSTLSKYFAAMAIIISCLGLFGLAAFSAERRRKEIGIRKVLGQTTSQVTFMLSSEFIKLVLIAIMFTLPVAYLLASNWLSQFAYKISLHAGYFLITGVLAIAVALLTVGSQAINAANKNPVHALKDE